MKKILHNKIRSLYLHLVATVLGLGMMTSASHAQILPEPTTFRIKVLQDSVYAGDTIDVEFYIGNGNNQLLSVLNVLKQMEIEVAADTSLLKQELTRFSFDNTSLTSFFGTTINNITTLSILNPVLGNLNIQVNSSKAGKGNALIGRGKYIVQDNVAGRQMMPYIFTKATASTLLLIPNQVKVITDSVLIISRNTNNAGSNTGSSTTTNNNTGTNNNPSANTPMPGIGAMPGSAEEEPSQTSTDPKAVPEPRIGDRSKKDMFEIEPSYTTIKVYPNPANDILQVEADNIQQYKLISIDGSIALSGDRQIETPLLLNVCDLNTGMYLLMVRTAEDWKSFKIVKK